MTHRIFFFALEMMKNLSNLSKPHLCHFWTNLQMLLGGIFKGPSIVGTNIVNAFYHEKKRGIFAQHFRPMYVWATIFWLVI